MLQSEYDTLVRSLRSREDVVAAAAAGPHALETLLSVYAQAYVRQTIRRAHLAKRHGDKFVRSFDRGGSLLDAAEEVNLSPTMVARRFLELKLGASRSAVTLMLREPASRIADPRVRAAVVECVENDEHHGPLMDRQRGVAGVEGEFVLVERLRNLGLQFETEHDLRARGTHKTPDVLLCVPVAFAGRTVCWIDSKAKFGDEYNLRKDYTDAVSSYVGRFGPGMVVYWRGFIIDCDTPMVNDSGVLIVDRVPDDIIMLPGTAVPVTVEDR